MINTLVIWAFALTICAFVLFVHSTLMMRKLIRAQQLSAWKMGTVVLSALVSIWSLFVAFGAFTMVPNFPAFYGTHFDIAFFMQFKANIDMATVTCQVQMAIVAIVFLIGVYLERGMSPVIRPSVQQVMVRERHSRR